MTDITQPISSTVRERAVKLSYAQAMLGAVYAASTGGMFLVGYALKLGAKNIHIGLMTSVPMYFIVVQLLAAILIERGVSRRALTLVGAFCNVAGWGLIILIPYALATAPEIARLTTLIGIITLVSIFAFISGNARGSWLGDLIPSSYMGTFFGRVTQYAGIVGAVFAVGEGAFLDAIKSHGIGAFTLLFAFGILFGIANACLFLPQPDVPLPAREEKVNVPAMVREALHNKPFMTVLLYALCWSAQNIGWPFYAPYILRDLKMPFLGLGIVNVASTITMLLTSPLWGRLIDRYGCRPVLIACTAYFVPLPLLWIWMTSPTIIYATIIPLNLIGGVAIAGISVALSTLLYKVTTSHGRAMQFAIYSIIINLLLAPLPTLGGALPDFLHAHFGLPADTRFAIYASAPFALAAVFAARAFQEPGSGKTGDLLRNLPGHLAKPKTLENA